MNTLRFADDANEKAVVASITKPAPQEEESLKPLFASLNGRTVKKETKKEKAPLKILGGGQVTVAPSLEAFKNRFGVIGEELADALSSFSLDIVGLVAEYFLSGVYTNEERVWILEKTFEKMGIKGLRVTAIYESYL